MKFFTKEVKIALVAIAAIIVLFIGMQFLKGMSLFSSNDVYYVCFDDVSGVSASSPVYANGYRVGVVKSIDYDYDHPDRIMVAVDLDPEVKLHEGTRAEIVSDFLGNVKLELRFGPADARLLSKGDTISGGLQAGLMSKAADMLPQVEQLLPKVDSILSGINALVADPALSGTMHNAQQLTASLNSTAQQLSRLTAQLSRDVPTMMSKASGVLTNTETLTGNLAQIDLDATMKKVDATLANVQQMTAALSNPKGTAGLLLNDAQLYNNINSTMRSVDSLLVDFKNHPRRYINVSVFGKKDKQF
ncbi:MAG: MCE family protein [Prevotella sp.]|nr:MCE family protein [Prevotella sp.]